MNARTAELNTITTNAGIDSILSGARLTGSPTSPAADGDPLPNNLEATLAVAGIKVTNIGAFPMEFRQEGAKFTNGQLTTVIIPNNITAADDEIEYWRDQTQKHQGEILIVSPNPSRAEYEHQDQLLPVVLWGNSVPPGSLTSASTRTRSLIVNTDIAPTVSAYFGQSLIGPYYGSTISAIPAGVNRIHDLQRRDGTWKKQAMLLEAMPYIASLITLLVFVSIRISATSSLFGNRIAAVCAAIPFLLVLSLLPTVIWIASSIFITAVLFSQDAKSVIWIGLVLMAILISADTLLEGGRELGASMIGYSPIEGARYYGIGGETMGVFVGTLVVIANWMRQGSRRLLLALYWITASLLLALPTLGAKAGGMIVCATILAATISNLNRRRLFDLRTVLLVLIAIGAAVGCLMVIGHFGPKTHVTQAMELARRSGSQTYLQIIARKTGMDFHLVTHSVWIWVLLATSIGRLQYYKFIRAATDISTFADTGTVAVLACLLFNDAGVVAAALCSLIIWAAELNGLTSNFEPVSSTTVTLTAV